MKDKKWKDDWDVSLGVSYIPVDKLDPQTDLVSLEDGGMFDDDTIPDWIKNLRSGQNKVAQPMMGADALGIPLQAVPHGVDPALAAAHGISLPGGPPPGVPPFGLPPGLPPPGGLLAPPMGAPGIIPPNLMQPRFAPPHGLPPPGFDISQPPPGIRMQFPPPNVVPNVEGQGDIEMEIEDQESDQGGPRGRKGSGDRGGRGGRGSRWNTGGGKENNEDNLQNRLRNLAGVPGGPDGPGGPHDGPPEEFMDMPPHGFEDRGRCPLDLNKGQL